MILISYGFFFQVLRSKLVVKSENELTYKVIQSQTSRWEKASSVIFPLSLLPKSKWKYQVRRTGPSAGCQRDPQMITHE